jgi:uncharacterized membrane protein YraQ (UPF0718 family)
MKELITQQQMESALRIISIAAPLTGLFIGAIIGVVRKQIVIGATLGFIVGLIGTGVFGLWRIYTALGDKYGYASVANIGFQMVIFAGVGMLAGVIIQKRIDRRSIAKVAAIESSKSNKEDKVNASKGL